ncbi:MAG: small subunit ribosomal protein S9 [Microgenomates group bacterium Gr01-1014_93]|nr:MAG: small subunit ribosomal protein S9 [Microgenomates group bacterium Gr01-1014_93]
MEKTYVSAVGRRKEAVARVRLLPGNSPITVNGKPIHEYFPGVVNQKFYQRPFEVVNLVGKYSGTIKVEGGGFSSQLGAVIHGISRALQIKEKDLRTPLKKAGLLTRDPRAKERRKYGNAQKARAKKQSPKR